MGAIFTKKYILRLSNSLTSLLSGKGYLHWHGGSHQVFTHLYFYEKIKHISHEIHCTGPASGVKEQRTVSDPYLNHAFQVPSVVAD